MGGSPPLFQFRFNPKALFFCAAATDYFVPLHYDGGFLYINGDRQLNDGRRFKILIYKYLSIYTLNQTLPLRQMRTVG